MADRKHTVPIADVQAVEPAAPRAGLQAAHAQCRIRPRREAGRVDHDMAAAIEHHQLAQQPMRVESLAQYGYRHIPHEHGENVGAIERGLDHPHHGLARQRIDIRRQPHGAVQLGQIAAILEKRYAGRGRHQTVDPCMHVGRAEQRRQRFGTLGRVDRREGFVRAVEHAATCWPGRPPAARITLPIRSVSAR